MIMNKVAFALTILIALPTLAEDDRSEWSPVQEEVWRTVQTRIDSWVQND